MSRTEGFLSRCALRGIDADYLETTPERMWDRVARTTSRNPRAATLFNCCFIPVREDSVDAITRWIRRPGRIPP